MRCLPKVEMLVETSAQGGVPSLLGRTRLVDRQSLDLSVVHRFLVMYIAIPSVYGHQTLKELALLSQSSVCNGTVFENAVLLSKLSSNALGQSQYTTRCRDH